MSDKTILVNERQPPGADGFHPIGTFRFAESATIIVSNSGTDGFVIVDAIQLLPAND